MATQGEDCSSCIWRSINDKLLARLTDVGEDQSVQSCANKRMGITDLLGPKVKDLASPGEDGTDNAEIVHECIGVASTSLKIRWVGQLATICIFGMF